MIQQPVGRLTDLRHRAVGPRSQDVGNRPCGPTDPRCVLPDRLSEPSRRHSGRSWRSQPHLLDSTPGHWGAVWLAGHAL